MRVTTEPGAHRRDWDRRSTAPTRRRRRATPGLDAAHASQAACFACHQILDPTAVDLLGDLLVELSRRRSTRPGPQQPGIFAFHGVIAAGEQHRRLRQRAGDPPAVRRRPGRRSSATTPTRRPATRRSGVPAASSATSRARATRGTRWCKSCSSSPDHHERGADGDRRRQRRGRRGRRAATTCAPRSTRASGFADVCGLHGDSRKGSSQQTIPEIVSGLPSDGYGRGATVPGAAEPADAVLPRRRPRTSARRSRRRSSTCRPRSRPRA